MYVRDRLPEAEMMTVGLPAIPEGSSIRKTNKLMPHQEGGCPAGVPHNIPPSFTSGAKKASPGDPLRNIANYRSAGWRKDLSHILRKTIKEEELLQYMPYMERQLKALHRYQTQRIESIYRVDQAR